MARKIHLFLIALALVILDQVSKYVLEGVNLVLVPKVLSLDYTENYGAVFGLMQGWNAVFVVSTIFVIMLLLWHFNKFGSAAGALFLVSGALGNLADRIFLGYVRDFISIGIWPTFNFADAFGIIGVVLIAYMSFKRRWSK